MQRINVKLFCYLLGGAVLFGSGLFVVHYFQSGRIAEALLWQAQRAEAKQDLRQTARYLARYLEFEPNDTTQRAHLGLVLANPKLAASDRARTSALFVLDQVVARETDRHDLRRPLARIATELGQFDLAWEHLEVLRQKFPKDGEVQFLRGQWYEAKKQNTKAAACYRQAVALAPKEPKYAVRLADLLYTRLHRPEAAQQVIEAVRKHAPDDSGVLLMAAGLAHALDRKAEAFRLLARGHQLYPSDPNFYKARAGLLIREDKRKEAVACLKDALKSLPHEYHADLLWSLANLLLDVDGPAQRAEARQQIARLHKSNLTTGAVDYLDARLLMCQGDWARAARLLERIRPRLDAAQDLSTQVNLFLGRCYEHMDDPGRRLDAFTLAVKEAPESVSARLELAAAWWAMDKPEEALDQLKAATALPRAPVRAWTEYARYLIARNRQQEKPVWSEVEKTLAEAARRSRTPRQEVDITLYRAEVLTAQQQYDQAQVFLQRQTDAHPAEVDLWLAQVALAEERGQAGQARRLLDKADRQLKDRVELRLARARYLVNQHGAAAAPDLANLAEGAERFDPPKQSELFRGLAEASYRINDLKVAARFLDRAAQLPANRNDLRIRLRLFDLYLETGNSAAVAATVEQLRRIEGPQGVWWRYGQASALIAKARRSPNRKPLLDEASRLLEAVAVRRQRWSAVFTAQAEVENLRGNQTRAREFTRLALAMGENNPRILRQIVQQVQALAAREERTAEADQKFQHARDLAGHVPEIQVAYVRYLTATGQRAKAAQVVRDAEGLHNSVPATLALGQCCEIIGNYREAAAHFKRALDAQPRDLAVVRAAASFYMRAGMTAQAEPLLDRIMRRQFQVVDADIAWARRARAAILATGNHYGKFRQALQLVGMKLDDSTGRAVEVSAPPAREKEETLRSRARVLASQSIGVLRKQAIELLQELETRGQLQPDDRYLMAELYEAEGERAWPRAHDLLRILAAGNKNPVYVSHLAQSLLSRNEFKEAGRWIDKLAQLEKTRAGQDGAFGSPEMKARLLELEGKPEQALALLQTYAQEKPVRPDRLLALAGMLARRNRLAEALDLCEQIRGYPPEVIGGAVVGLLRAGQPAEKDMKRVEAYLQDGRKKDSASPILTLQLADLYDLAGRSQDAETLYRQVLEKDPDNVMALNNLAWLLAQRPRHAAEARKWIDQAIAVLGPRPELLDTRAVVSLALGRPADAIADLKRANADTPSPSRYFHLARALHLDRQPAQALKAFEKARAGGLEPKRLHPAERAEFDKMTRVLYQR